MRLPKQALRINDAAEMLGISRQAVQSLCERGLLPGAKQPLGPGTPWLIPLAAVQNRLANPPPGSPTRPKSKAC